MATRKFNIDEVVAGAKIVQRSGDEAKFVAYVTESTDQDNVLWLNEKGEVLHSYPDGTYYDGEDSERDLLIYEPDPPSPEKIIQLYVGDVTISGSTYEVWQDTCWRTLSAAKREYPEETYREITTITPEHEKVPYVKFS